MTTFSNNISKGVSLAVLALFLSGVDAGAKTVITKGNLGSTPLVSQNKLIDPAAEAQKDDDLLAEDNTIFDKEIVDKGVAVEVGGFVGGNCRSTGYNLKSCRGEGCESCTDTYGTRYMCRGTFSSVDNSCYICKQS